MTAAMAGELGDRLGGARVRAFLLDGEGRRVLLYARSWTLALELHPTDGWLTLLEPVEPPSEARPLASRVVGVEALPDDSVMILGLQRVRGRDEGLELVVEWVGNRWNAVMVGHRSRMIRHVLVPRPGGGRPLVVGAPYEPPSTTGRSGTDGSLSRDEWDEILREAGGELEERRRALMRAVAYTSSINVDHFLAEDGWSAWRSALDPDRWGGHLLDTDRGLQPYPITLSNYESTDLKRLISAVEAARAAASSRPARAVLLPPGLLEQVEDRRRRADGRLRGLERELEKARDPGPIRALGDLILARFGDIPRGRKSVLLKDFEGGQVEVKLDPALPPEENARRYYDEAARIERARRDLPARIEKAKRERDEWDRLIRELVDGTADVEEVARRVGPKPKPGTKGGTGPSSLPYRSYRSSGGMEIRVGRGARQNDDLTFRHSSPDDIWLHARQASGAHVILRWNDQDNPPRRDLLEAAVLAALHSEARHSGSVPVDWTRRKYVRKPRKAGPGAVVPDRVQTVFVEPDPELAERLQNRE